MIGATPLTAILGSGADPTDHEAMRAYIRALCNAGLAVLFIQPGTKAPADMRTPQKRNADDRAAREAAREAGRPDWERVRAPAGLALATTDATTALRYLDKYVEVYSTFTNDDGAGNQTEPRMAEPVAVSLALEVGRSRLVTVDCDTAEQTAEFLAMSGAPPDTPPTVRSPGKVAPDGTWLHRDGGHFDFTLPEDVSLPTEQGSMNLGETGFAVMWSSRYVLIPPSRRAEGPYELTGRDYPVPDWIATEIDTRCRARRQRIDRRAAEPSELGDAIDRWAAAATWESILAPLGWVPASADSSCGCPAWTAPGDHASPKSATAHDAGCTSGLWSSDVNAPLHIWTDHPGEPFDSWIAAHDGITTLTKFQAVVASEYGGDMAAAVDDLGLAPGQVSIEGVSLRNLADQPAVANLAPDDEPVTANLGQELPAFEATSLADLADDTFPDTGGTDPATGLYLPSNDGMPRIAPLAFWADVDPPQFIIDGLFEHGGLSALIGAPGVGKSSVVLDMICHIATGRAWQGRQVLKTRVLYLPGEGLAGAVQRIMAWCEARNTPPELDLEIGQPIIQLGATREAWAELRAYVARREIGLIVFDTFARMATGIEENSATEVGLAIKRFDQVREMTNCGVMVVHHTGKANPTAARGSSALNGAVDSEVLVVADDERVPHGDDWARPIRLRVTKQKNAEYDGEWTELLMTNWQGRAPLITGPTGSIDPMQGEILLARPVAEPLIETAVRIRGFVDRFTEQGVTRTDIMAGVDMDPYTRERRNAARHWRLKVAEAVDRALRYGLLETLSGTPSGARYVPGPVGVDAARAVAADEAMVPGQ